MGSGGRCRGGGETKPNGNCSNPGRDGLVVQCVGAWAREKHDYVRRYIEATHGARQKYLAPKGRRPAGGAAYIELFAGPGGARIRTSGEIIDGSPLIGARHTVAPFTRLIFADKEPENIEALNARLKALSRPADTFCGDCNDMIDQIVRRIPPHGLNLALVDPYGLAPLSFETVGKLAAVKRMDMIIHFPTMDVKRNFANAEAFITRFLGTDTWKSRVTRPQDAVRLIIVLYEQLAHFGYTRDHVRVAEIKTKGHVLYHLVFATKVPLGNKIWQSIVRTDAKGQRTLPGID